MAAIERVSQASERITVHQFAPDDAQSIDERFVFDPQFRSKFIKMDRFGEGQAVAADLRILPTQIAELQNQIEHSLALDMSLVNISTVPTIICQGELLAGVLKHEAAKQKLLLLAVINIEDENLNITTALHKMTRRQGSLAVFLSDPEAAQLYRESLCASQGFGYPSATITNTLLCGSGIGLKAFLEHSPEAGNDLIFAIEGHPNHQLLNSDEIGYDYFHPSFYFKKALEREDIRSILSHYECFHFWLHPDRAPKVEPPDF